MNKKLFVKNGRMPNLSTILMIEDILKSQKKPLNLSSIKEKLPTQVMHQTLQIALKYLWQSKKIDYTPEGITWAFEDRK